MILDIKTFVYLGVSYNLLTIYKSMKLKEFYIEGLFDLYNHTIDFTNQSASDNGANVIMIYGKNGVGKTTILRMIDGFMTLNFDEFRKSKFKSAHLVFSNSNIIKVSKINLDKQSYLEVSYKSGKQNLKARLNVDENFVDTDENFLNKNIFIAKYRQDLENFTYEFIDTERLIKRNIKDEIINERYEGRQKIRKYVKNGKSSFLNDKIRDFIKDSQINSSHYFRTNEPDLFEKVLENIDNQPYINYLDISKRLTALEKFEKNYKFNRLKLSTDNWDYKKIKNKVEQSIDNQLKLNIIWAYINVYEAKIIELANLANRLLVFENSLNNYLTDKKIEITSKGFEIHLDNSGKDEIFEQDLSTGEYHLLYLTVLALCTKVRGSVIAIDEPEMSMHITWQRKLVNTLTTIASNATPQMIFATHSPDIAENYSNSLTTEKYVLER